MKIQNILLVFILISMLSLAGCADRSPKAQPQRDIQVSDELDIEEVPDEQLPEDDSDLELDPEIIGTETTTKSLIDFGGLDLELEETEDEELPEDDVQELE